MRITMLGTLAVLAAGFAAPAAAADGALPAECAWHMADAAFTPSQYLTCLAADGSTEVEAAPVGSLGTDRAFDPSVFAAADAGDGAAMRIVGDFYDGYWKTKRDHAAATGWYRRAAQAGDAQGMALFALALHNGNGVAKDVDAAQVWLSKAEVRAVAVKDTRAMVMISNCIAFMKLKNETTDWVRRAAENGDSLAMLQMASRYALGLGAAKDGPEALRWYRAILASGDPDLLPLVGSLYRRGLFPMAKDGAEAARIYRLAADKGDVDAMGFLAEMYESGDGVAQDWAEAARWNRRAAALGDPGAMEALAKMYREGRGVAADPAAAERWSQAAAARWAQTPKPPVVMTIVAPKKP